MVIACMHVRGLRDEEHHTVKCIMEEEGMADTLWRHRYTAEKPEVQWAEERDIRERSFMSRNRLGNTNLVSVSNHLFREISPHKKTSTKRGSSTVSHIPHSRRRVRQTD